MFKFLSRFRQENTRQFKGGIHPPEMKTQSNGTPLTHLPLPPEIILPIKQHIGNQGEILVRIGDKVLRGQPLTFGQGKMLPVHASTSGTVTAIKPHITAHPSALSEISIFITPDGEDRWAERQRIENFRVLDRQEIINRIQAAGVAGLGGAGFPTATKLRGGLPGVNTLIINAAECEPYITADDRIMQDCAEEILTGVRILGWVLQAEQILIGIEDNKPEAISALRKALGDASDLFIRVIPTKYPSGGAKQLTKILTGREVPKGGRSSDIGVLMQNVGTAYAVKRAIVDGEPLTERVVTLTGDSLTQPRNVWGRLGTPVSHLLEFAGFKPGSNPLVIMGGPLMGFTLPSLSVSVVKITNCLLAPSAEEMGHQPPEQSCIRCSACADACPAGLLPQQLYWYCQGGDHEKARAYHLNDCIECGACAWVCPSNIPLVQYYRQEKAELSAIDLEARRTAEAKVRFEARQTRLEQEKLARETRHNAAKQAVTDTDKDRVSAAHERVKARQHATQQEAVVGPDSATGQAQCTDDSRKAAVNAAIARVKARKTAISDTAEEPVVTADNVDRQNPARTVAVPETTKLENQRSAVDPRKAALAAAVARAKAKRAAQGSASGSLSESSPCPSDHHQAHPPSSVAEE